MATLSDVSPARRPRRILRWLRNGLIGVGILIVLAVVAGASYQAIETRKDSRRFPQQGKSVRLEDFSLNLDCSGQGSPTVILDSGLGVPAVGWKFVQQDVAKFTRVCSYDRAGYGWSDAAPLPRTSAQIVKELHALLEAAGEKGPYVLAGHSFGGYNIRVYNGSYPNDVSGMVLVDASHEDQTSRMPPSLQAFMDKQVASLKWQKLLAPVLIRLGIARLTDDDSDGFGLSKEFRQEIRYLGLQSKFVDATIAELEAFSESAGQVRAAGNLGDKPLIVLTAGKSVDEKSLPKGIPVKEMDDFRAIWMNELQVREARLSTAGKQVIVPDSDHMIPFERPDAVVAAIREVCAAAGARSR